MLTDHEITWITKSDRPNTHERIKYVGGINTDGSKWKLSQAEAIIGIEQGKRRFYVSVNGKPIWVVIAIGLFGNKYIKTENDREQPTGLLSLPECF